MNRARRLAGSPGSVAVLAAAVACAAGCATDKILLLESRAPTIAADGGAASDAHPPAVAIHLGDNSDDPLSCTAAVAASTLRQGLCTCDNLELLGTLWTFTIDSARPISDPEKFLNASVGTNGAFLPFASFIVNGAVVVAGLLKSSPFAFGAIKQALRTGDVVEVQQRTEVGGDAWINGSVSGDLNVRGTLHLPPGASVGDKVNADEVTRERLGAVSPCACEPGRVAVNDLIARRGAANDNAANGFDPRVFADSRGHGRVDLVAGSYYVPNGISATRDLTIAVHGPVALYVAGPLSVKGAFTVTLGAGASLDLFFAGDLLFGSGNFGDPAHPARVRLWSTEARQLTAGANITIGASIWAPAAQLVVTAPFPGVGLNGALLSRSVSLAQGSALTVSFDRALLTGGFAECSTVPTQPLQ